MNEKVSVPGETLARLLGEFLVTTDIPTASEWFALLESVHLGALSGNLAEKEYWIDIYQRRQEVAANFDPGLADDLARVVNDISRFDGEIIALVIINRRGYGHFVWVSPDLSSVVSCFRARDKRSP